MVSLNRTKCGCSCGRKEARHPPTPTPHRRGPSQIRFISHLSFSKPFTFMSQIIPITILRTQHIMGSLFHR